MIHSDFVHLHVHTQYSLLDGACLLERLIERARQFKLPALAITDHGNLFGAIKFYNLCIKAGIKPIIGCEVYLARGSRFKKDYRSGEDSNFHLLLLAKDEGGYKNLIKLVSLGYLEGFYYKPRVDKELLYKYSKGLLGLSACLKGEIASAIISGDVNKAYKLADEYLNIFGQGNFYLEIMENGLPEQKKVNQCLLKIAKDLNIPLVATNDVHYLEKNSAFAHEALLCIQTQTTISDPKHFKFNSDTFYFRSPQEMKSIFKEIPSALKNTLEITQKCNLILDFSKTHLPSFPLPWGETDEGYLKKICYENLLQRYPQSDKAVTQRLEHELSVIEKVGFSSYFLIVWDLVKFAKENHIPVGPGRGSVTGSIVSYLLGITDIDPLLYGLFFERFLNPARISMPDIDIDFCYERRQEVLNYVATKYGKENVAQIITFGTMLARAVVRDVGRVLEVSYSEVDKIAKMIPYSVGHATTLAEALSINPELKGIYDSDSRIKRLIDVATQLEGLSRHASTHAAGVVISDKPLTERIPLVRVAEEEIVTGFDMQSVEKIGLLKMDFLGLKTLTVIEETVKIIKRTKGESIDIKQLPLDDKKAFFLLSEGDAIGIFQLESRGMRDILRKLNPTNFKDLIAVLALYRPGPLGSGMVDDFIDRRQGKKPVVYVTPKLEPILKETYGIILYQEQTMQIVSSLAGFDMARADLLRKAIGKKIPEIMEEQKKLFIEGCRKNNVSYRIANQIFDLIDYFSGYGFNKSHSTAYALISYRTAYLKANYTTEFMAALLTSERNNTDKIVEYVNEAVRCGIEVFPPDINTSFTNFTVTDDGNIRFGLMAIKNVGKAALESIIAERAEKRFETIFDFCQRVDSRAVNKKVIESLIKAGAMDTFGLKRAQMMVISDRILSKGGKKRDTSQLFLFSFPQDESIPDIEEWPLAQVLDFEKSLLGIYLTSHPLRAYSYILNCIFRKQIVSLYEQNSKEEVIISGIVEKARIITTRKGNKRMAFLKIEDQTASVEVIVFPRLFEEVSAILKEKTILIIKGILESKEKIPKILASQVISMEAIYDNIKRINISIDSEKGVPLDKLKNIFVNNHGKIPAYFIVKNSIPKANPAGKSEEAAKSCFYQKGASGGVKIKTANEFCLNLNEEILKEMSSLVGEENLSLIF
ncbi:MAG: DNA polymerase III subunit alpha [Candidatus Omnitrophica bacterium]|nr:DNA polymerase III subunit alpha [Candidatus Omnitrophota bacterium]